MTPITDDSHALALAAAYARGALGQLDLSDEAALALAHARGLRLHRFKRVGTLPRIRRVLGVLRGLGVRHLLDVGSGRGAFLWPLLEELDEVEVTAVDVLPYRAAGIACVRRGGVQRLRAAVMDAHHLALVDGAVDAVTLLEVLEHVKDPPLVLAEAMRVARTAVIITVPSKEDDNPEHVHLFDGATLEAMCRKAGGRRVTFEHVVGHIVVVAMVRR